MGRGSRGLLEGAGRCRLIGGLDRGRPVVVLRRVLTSWWAAAKDTKPAQRPETTLSNGRRRSGISRTTGGGLADVALGGVHHRSIMLLQESITLSSWPILPRTGSQCRSTDGTSIIRVLSDCSVPSYRTEDAHTARRTEYRWP